MTLHSATPPFDRFHLAIKIPLMALLCASMTASACAAGQEQDLLYSKPLQGFVVDSVASVVLRMKDDAAPAEVSDREWTQKLLATITDRDFPQSKEPLGFALPGELCTVEFRDAAGKPLRLVTVFAAWNLLSVTSDTTTALGSNRHFADAVIRKLEETHPDYVQKQRKTYGDHFSGKYQKEYHEVVEGEKGVTPSTKTPTR